MDTQWPPRRIAQRDYLMMRTAEQLGHWYHALGLTWPDALYRELIQEPEIPWLQPLIDAGDSWVQSYLLPRDDRLGMLEYMTHSRRVPGLTWRCRYVRGGWVCLATGEHVHGVTHWRIARPGEGPTEIDPDELPGHYLDLLEDVPG